MSVDVIDRVDRVDRMRPLRHETALPQPAENEELVFQKELVTNCSLSLRASLVKAMEHLSHW